MNFTYTGNNGNFLFQSFFDQTGASSYTVTSVTPTEMVVSHTLFANVDVTFTGNGFSANAQGDITGGTISSILFEGNGIAQATITDITWSAVAFDDALRAIDVDDYRAPLAALINQEGPLTLDASDGLTRYDQEFAWNGFLELLTVPMTLIGSSEGDSLRGGPVSDTIRPGTNPDTEDRIVGTPGDDQIDFSPADGESAYWLDYDDLDAGVTFNIDADANTGTVQGSGFTDTLINVRGALEGELGLEGTVFDDTYNITASARNTVLINANEGADTYNLSLNPDAIAILFFDFGADIAPPSGLRADLESGTVQDDGFGDTDRINLLNDTSDYAIFATNNADRIEDSTRDDLLFLFGGNDIVIGGRGGNDSIDGGDGVDTLAYDTPRGSLTIEQQPGVSYVTDRSVAGSRDAIISIETILTEEGAFQLSNHDGIVTLTESDLEQLTELYIAYFDRAPDALGLTFWAEVLSRGALDLRDIAADFFTQPETTSLYDGLDTGDFVTEVYNNVLGRDPDTPGFEFWTDQITSGNVTESEFILELLAGARAATGSFADVVYTETKTDIGLYFAVIQGQGDLDAAQSVMDAFDGSVSSIATAQSLSDNALAAAEASDTDLLLPVVGVIESPFAEIA